MVMDSWVLYYAYYSRIIVSLKKVFRLETIFQIKLLKRYIKQDIDLFVHLKIQGIGFDHYGIVNLPNGSFKKNVPGA